MSLQNPFVVDPPEWVRVSTGFRGAILQSDGTALPRVHVYWKPSTDPNVLSGGRVEVDLSINGGAWIPCRPYADGATDTIAYPQPVEIGAKIRARARFVNGAGTRSAIVESIERTAVDPVFGTVAHSYISTRDGWTGLIEGGTVEQAPGGYNDAGDSMLSGFVGLVSNGEAVPMYGVVVHDADTIIEGWKGELEGGAPVNIGS